MPKLYAVTFFALAHVAAFSQTQPAPTWNPEAARSYLDSRMTWWNAWPVAARDHDTVCVSCHTALPYALASPVLGALIGHSSSDPQQRLLASVTKRVRMWNDVAPFYPDKDAGPGKTPESRGTESILNAVVLVSNRPASDEARLALANMWSEQLKTGDFAGAWNWLQFHNAPWEGDSQYFGATLAGLAAGMARDTNPGIKSLRDYLLREESAQVLVNRIMLLWAATKLKTLLTAAQQDAIVQQALGKQQPDGGFSLTSLVGDWKRHDGTALETTSDGLATALVSLALLDAGIPGAKPELARAIHWLKVNQNPADGRWIAHSLNKQRDLSSDVGKFMCDAATAYAVLALSRVEPASAAPGTAHEANPGQ